ncbi:MULTISPECIES: hypothetical protein [unclassified Sporosarcina]|uniref:hypothetical protein n=1 Tax=unclassified Sporosarcina TaxID=2647733 RepID=UPI00203EFB8C|nr:MULTISPECIES: hypothetical protein [unclassified Sporosarcina]GKV65494.1 hypothetical protein NCCP2331_16470 [Sporosarcina sp. NCCP-2331]GLB55619.1 hypothetical protein NCCP2378_14060 [Sporosarcina sp. NCCP-2378]
MQVGTRVKVSNKNQINYPLKGIVVEKETSPCGVKMSKVKFTWVECWYADEDLKELK